MTITGDRPRVLVVDDEPMNLDLLRRTLRRKYEVMTAEGAEAALEIVQNTPDIALILCDYRMPVMNGTEFLARAVKHIPGAKRVIITGYADVDGIIDAINQGQVHYYVKKPWNHKELDQMVDNLIRLHQLESENARLLEELQQANSDLKAKERLLSSDLDERARELLGANSELERVNRELESLAYRDGLTGLYNHRTFQERLREEIARARRYSKPLSLLLGDLDDFHRLNEQQGHPMGDEILRRLADVLKGAEGGGVRESDILARYGGEEFAILLPETPREGARTKAIRLCELIRTATFPGGHRITMSFGVSSYPEDAHSAEELIAFADHALYVAKNGGRDQVKVYGIDAKPSAGEPHSGHVGTEVEESGIRGGEELGGALSPVEDYPTYYERLFSIIRHLEKERALGCLYVDLSHLRRVELEYGITKHNELMRKVGDLLTEMRADVRGASDLLCRADSGDAFVFFVSAARSKDEAPEELGAIALRVQELVDGALARDVFDLIHDHPRVAVGYARVLHNPMIRPERLVSRLVEETRASAQLMRDRQAQRDKHLLQDIILSDGLTPVYQPIVHLDSGEIFGFEALTRGPKRSPLEAPLALFGVAEEVNLLFELDRACFRGAMRGAAGLEPVHRLFVNLLPLSFYDASFVQNEVLALLEAANLTPANVVFEITEQKAIENFRSFRRALAVYTNLGFGVAIDDVGTKHSNLEAVMSLRPHFVKLSDVLTRGAAKSTVKREMLRSLGRICEAIDAVMVAEGIETPDDLVVLKDLGVKYGQGYFLARPGAPFPRLRASVKRAVRALASGSTPIPAPPSDIEEDEDGIERTNPGQLTAAPAGDFDDEHTGERTGDERVEGTDPGPN